MSSSTPPHRHLSLIRDFHLADFVTLGNAACGMAGILLAMMFMISGALADFLWAAAMAPLALAFDWLDGRVARWRRQHSHVRPDNEALERRPLGLVPQPAQKSGCGGVGGWRLRQSADGFNLESSDAQFLVESAPGMHSSA
jgi:CDP-diacylglycerol--serine O-phosphatidyltransferase